MQPIKTFNKQAGRLLLYSDRLEVEEKGCFSRSKTKEVIPVDSIRRIYNHKEWLHIETGNGTSSHRFHGSESLARHKARQAATELNKHIL